MADYENKPEQFVEALRRRNLEGKRTLIADLRQRKTEKAVRILVDVLRDDSWYLRELAVDALADAGDTAVEPLTRLLDGGLWYTRAAAARTLGKLGHYPSIPRLVALLDDTNQTVQGASLASLSDFVLQGRALQVARAFLDRGPERAEDLKRLFLAVHPEPAALVGELLDDPATLTAKTGGAPATESPTIPVIADDAVPVSDTPPR